MPLDTLDGLVGAMLIATVLAASAPTAHAADFADAVKLDFGEEDGAVFDGFTPVTPYTSGDARIRWAAEPGGTQSQTWSDPLVDDQVRGGTLHLDLAPGTYTVAALFEDSQWGYRPPVGATSGLRVGTGELVTDTIPEGRAFFASGHYAANPRPVFRPEQSAFDRQMAPRHTWRTDTLVVPEGGVDIEIFGAPLSALIVSPTDLATLEVELALIQAQRRTWHVAHRPAIPIDLPWATDDPLRLEVVPWDRTPDPANATRAPSTTVAVSPGQRVSLLVALHGPDSPAQVAIDGLEALAPSLHEVTWLDVNEQRRLVPRPHVLRPTDGPIVGGQGVAPLVALTFRVPDDAVPSTLPGRLAVTRGDDSTTLVVDVRVRRLHLAPPVSQFGVWVDLRGPVAQVYGPDDPAAKAVWRTDVALMREHDIDIIALRGAFFPGSATQAVPRERLEWATQAWRDAGGGRIIYADAPFSILAAATPDDPDSPLSEAGRAWLDEAFAVAAELDMDINIGDEDIIKGGPGIRAEWVRRFDAMNAINAPHRARLSGATQHAASWPLAAPRLDLVFIDSFPALDPRHFSFFDGTRATPYAYNLTYAREATSVLGWMLGTDAVVIWSLNDSNNDPFDETHGRRQWQLAILAPDGESVWPTRRLEDLSLGIQDQRAISTAAGLVDEVGHKKKAAPHVARACALLRAAGDGLVGRLPSDFDDLGLRDDRSLQDLADSLSDEAEVLARWSKAQRAKRRDRDLSVPAARWPERCGTPPWDSDGAERP